MANENVVLMTVSVDDPDDEKAVRKFLDEQEPPGPDFLIADDDGLKSDWGYEYAPYLIVVDREGKRAKAFTPSDHFSDKDVEAIVKKLLKE